MAGAVQGPRLRQGGHRVGMSGVHHVERGQHTPAGHWKLMPDMLTGEKAHV